jgi:nucleotide-binding universal stress UspA family protein
MGDDVFTTIVCGIDGTPASTTAVRQAARLADRSSRLLLVSVVDEASAAAATAPGGGIVLPPPTVELEDELLDQAAAAASAARPNLNVEKRVLEGPVLPTLLGALTDEKATLAVVGRHGHSRLAGIVLGSAMTTVLHDAPCSVLVAGGGEDEDEGFPRSIVVGYDGSEPADEALRVAADVAHRTEALLEAVCARGGKDVDLGTLQARLTELAAGVALTVEDREPVAALAGAGADLVVVGHRGLHGMKALGSVSERVAHKADGAVLVVR